MNRRFFFSRPVVALSLALACLLLTHCGGKREDSEAGGKGKPTIVATTTMLADMARALAGDDADVIGLMSPGVDPHTYELPARAIGQIRGADAILYNGLLLEGKIAEILEPLGEQGKPVVPVAERLPKDRLLVPEGLEAHGDPHVWGDAKLWADAIDVVLEALGELMPEKKGELVDRATAYTRKVEQLDEWIRSRVAEVPEAHRTLVTSHDAFNYFGKAYGFEVIGVQGISTATDAGMADIVNTVDLVKERGVKAIFVESSVSKATIERIAKDAGVVIGGELFSDSCGPAGEMKTVNGETYDVGTYLGMMKHNVNTVVEALK